MDIYRAEFVRFEWSDDLIGKKAVMFDHVSNLKDLFGNGMPPEEENCLKSGDRHFPFMASREDGSPMFRFCYFDPLYEYKRAHLLGKKVECRRSGLIGWQPVDEDCLWEAENWEYRIIPDMPDDRFITNIELSRWVAKGRGQILADGFVTDHWGYQQAEADLPVPENVKMRRWEDGEWHSATDRYCHPKEGSE